MSDSISLPYYQASNRLPGFFFDIDGSQANTATVNQRTLIVGQMMAGGLFQSGQAVLVTSLGQVGLGAGVGSMLYGMVQQYRLEDSFGELWVLPEADPAGSKATGSFALPAGPYPTAGLLNLYIAGILTPVPILAGDTATTLAARIVTTVSANPALPFTVAAPGGTPGTVTVTANHVGLLGNDITIVFNYLGTLGGQSFPSGFTAPTVTAMTGGTGTPQTIGSDLSNLGDQAFDFICSPYSDTGTLNALDGFLSESTGGRWSWQQMIFGFYFTAIRGTVGSLATIGTARDGKWGSGLMVLPGEPDPVWIHAADYCGVCAQSLRNDPNLPLQYIVLGTKAPPVGDRVTMSLLNTLLYDGISVKSVNDFGQNELMRSCTFYQENAAGVPDNSFLDTETAFGLQFLLRGWRQAMASQFPRKKLVQDGTPIPAGSNLVSPGTITAATVAWYAQECAAGNAQNPTGFAKACFSQNAGSGLVKELLPFILVNQLRQIAGLAQFTKP